MLDALALTVNEPNRVVRTLPPVAEVRFEFERLDGPFGVVVRGLEWSEPTREVVETLTRALRRHLLLVFRGQRSPNHDELDTFFRAFGRLLLETEDGTFHYKKFSKDQAEPVHRREDGNYLVNTDDGAGELIWHNDQFHKPQIKLLSVLEAIEFETGAAPTCFRDMYTAYELLPNDVRARLEYKQSINFDPRLPGVADLPRLCDAMHPIFTPHPESGRRALYVNDFTARIAGLEPSESQATLSELRAFADRNALYYEHHWLPGDLLVWDNVGLQHRRDAMPPGKVRVLRVFEGVAER
jgi:alpha-ketoglutarate-dependent taurine dioxygenase